MNGLTFAITLQEQQRYVIFFRFFCLIYFILVSVFRCYARPVLIYNYIILLLIFFVYIYFV